MGNAIDGSEGPVWDEEDPVVRAGFALDSGDVVEDTAVVGLEMAGVGKVIAVTDADAAEEAVAEQD